MKLSIIIPCYNEEETIKKMYEECVKELKANTYELIFINDGSTDKTYSKIKELYDKDKLHIKAINFSRNFKKEAAIYAGIKHATGEYTAIIDADMQQHPKYLIEMMDFLDENSDIDQIAMYVEKRNKSITSFFSKTFYKLINKMSDIKLKNNASDFRMFRENVRNAVLEISEVNRFSKGIFAWVGFETHFMPYEVMPRVHGKTKFSFKTLTKYAIDGIVSFSVKPLAFATYSGIISSIVAFIYFIYLIIKTLVLGIDLPGYASTLCIILILGGIQLLSIGILGEYLSRTYLESKKRPIYLEKNKIGFDNELL